MSPPKWGPIAPSAFSPSRATRRTLKARPLPPRSQPEYGSHPSSRVPRNPTGTVIQMIALVITAVTLTLVGAVVISLERHRRLTLITALITGLGALAVVIGAITATTVSILPAEAEVVPRGVTTNQLPERVADVDLPTL